MPVAGCDLACRGTIGPEHRGNYYILYSYLDGLAEDNRYKWRVWNKKLWRGKEGC